jgi:hypothetical protein
VDIDRRQSEPATFRVGTGLLFVASSLPKLEPMPPRPTLLDFFERRLPAGLRSHLVQSATHAQKAGQGEETVLACLLHDLAIALARVDHGYWGAQLVEPYVSERVSWAIRYHQALRFYPDPEVGYEYPPLYDELFGKDYVPPPYIQADYEHARGHRWYMEARQITLHDDYCHDVDAKISLDSFVDLIGRHFRQPKEGLGYDGTAVAHMWRTLAEPERPL